MWGITERVVALLGIPRSFTGDAGLSASSSLSASGTRVQVTSSALTAQSDLSAAGTHIGIASASLSGESALSVSGTMVALSAANMAAEGSLTATALLIGVASSIEVGSSDLTATALRVIPSEAALAADSDLSAVGGIIYVGESALSADGDLTASGTYVQLASVTPMSGTLTVTPPTPLPIYRLAQPQYETVYTTVLPMSRYGIDTAKTIYIKDNVVVITDYVYQDEIESADYAFLGGRHYQLTEDQYQAFVAAGRPDLVEVA